MPRVYELDNEREYEAEVSQCIGVTGYHHWFFLSAMAEALNLKFRAFAVDSNNVRLGVVPLLFRSRGPVSTVNILPVGCIGPLIRGDALRAGLIRELVKGVEPILRRHRTVATRWAFSPQISMSSSHLDIPGFDVLEEDSYVIPGTKSIDDCLKLMSRVRRQSIRQTESHGVSVRESTMEEITKWLPEQITIVYERQGLEPLYKMAEVQSLTEQLATHPRMLWRTATAPDDRVLGMTGCVISDDRLWGWLMVGPPAPGISAQTLCYWDLIKWSLSRGLAYDLGGVPNEGIRKFKISLGAEAETIVAAHRVRPKAAYKVGTALYTWGINQGRFKVAACD